MRKTVLVAGAALAGAVAFPSTGVSVEPVTGVGNISAWPYKTPLDGGTYQVASLEAFDGPFGAFDGQVDGYDPCVFDFEAVQPATSNEQTIQQYLVPNCAPVISPWITTKAAHNDNWVLTCPASAPYSYAAIAESTQDVRESVALLNGSVTVANWGPNPRGAYSQSYSNWGTERHSWAWSMGCGDQFYGYDWYKDRPNYTPYTGGTVPTASVLSPNLTGVAGSGGPVTAAALSSRLGHTRAGTAARASSTTPSVATRGPAFRALRVDAANITRTIEVDLRPNRTRRHRATCPRGHRVSHVGHAVGWYTRKPPTRKQAAMVDHERRATKTGRGLEVRVTTKRTPKNLVRLQVHYGCTTEAA